uniref:DUF4094 domain-containing protein n=1 Tax=Picea sitchensis TaxID=3332 RepID=A9P1N6_PICSI|nr:unknown [Picea sitchensis]
MVWGGRHTRGGGTSSKWLILFCIASFCFGMLVTNRSSTSLEANSEL